MSEEEKWKKRLERERSARAQAEALLEEKSTQLYEANQRLERRVDIESGKFLREEKKFRALFDSSIDGILLYSSTSGKVIIVNKAISSTVKAENYELKGKSVRAFFDRSKKTRKKIRLAAQQLKENGSTRFECEITSFEGHKVPCEISANQFLLDDEVVVQAIIRDITERNEINRSLKEATQTAIDASKAKSMFLATMSHEIRTPLNAIIGFTDILVQEDLKKDHLEYLELIKKSGGLLLSVINDVLDFSKIEYNQIELEVMDFNLQDCIEETLDIHAQVAGGKNVELLYHIEPNIELGLRGDVGRLRQILMNLIGNALKFTSKGSVILTAKKASDHFVELKVKDTGIGFDAEVAEHLFSPFHQADASTTRKFGGTGLGLSICRQLIELMGGSISAKSEIGKGAEFTILLPYNKSHSKISRNSEMSDLSWLAGKRALVVDDNDINLTFMRARLETWKMNVTTCLSGKIGLEFLAEESNQYDFIMLDMLMPEMDGLDLTKKIVELFAGKSRPPIMMITSSRLSNHRSEAFDIGIDSVIYKPLHEKELISELRRLFRRENENEMSGELSRLSPAKNEKGRHYALLVEDNPINAKLATLLLERMGLSVHVAHNGKEALDALKLNKVYEVIFMDMQMPVMDGIEATKRIRKGEATEHYSHIPIVAMTANVSNEDELKCVEAGMNYFITKPIKKELLIETLEELQLVQ